MNADQMKEFVELCKHPAIAGKVGEDCFWCEKCQQTESVFGHGCADEHGEAVILPPVYDYQHPERGLWGMVEWDNATIINTVSNGIVCVFTYGPVTQHFGPLPIALAKAVIWQSERKEP